MSLFLHFREKNNLRHSGDTTKQDQALRVELSLKKSVIQSVAETGCGLFIPGVPHSPRGLRLPLGESGKRATYLRTWVLDPGKSNILEWKLWISPLVSFLSLYLPCLTPLFLPLCLPYVLAEPGYIFLVWFFIFLISKAGG